MYTYKQYVINKILAAITVVALLHGYCAAANDSIVGYIKCPVLSTADFNAFCRNQHYDSAKIALAYKQEIFVPPVTDSIPETPVYTSHRFSIEKIEKSLKPDTPLQALLAYTAVLYKLIAEPVKMNKLVLATNKSADYYDRSLSAQSVFDSLSTAAWAFDCGGHAEMAKLFLDTFAGSKYVTKTGRLDHSAGDEVNHIVALVYYRDNNQWYGVAVDCQNGKIGPVKSTGPAILSVAEQRQALNGLLPDSLEIISLPDTDLRQKRNLVNQPFYSNVLPDDGCRYRLAFPQSGYKYERLTYSAIHYTWFKAGYVNLTNYKQNLLALLVKNAP